MDYEVSVSKQQNYILIKLNTPMTIDLGRRCGRDAVELGRRHDIKRYLFDVRGAPNIEPILSNYEFAYRDLEQFEFPKGSQSALLTDPDDRSHDFMETLFLNAGYYVRLFTDEQAAIAWLEANQTT